MDTPAIKTQIVQEDGHLEDSVEEGMKTVVRRTDGPRVAADAVSAAGTASAKDPSGQGDPTAFAEAAPAESRIETRNIVSSIPDERAVWVSQRLRIRSTQNLVDADLDVDATPQVSGRGGEYGAAVPDAGPLQPPGNEQNQAAIRQRNRNRRVRDASSSGAAVARYGSRTRRNDHALLTRAGTKTVPGSTRTGRKVRVKAFDIRVEEYKEVRRHVSDDGFS